MQGVPVRSEGKEIMYKIVKIVARCTLIFPLVELINMFLVIVFGFSIVNHNPDREGLLFMMTVLSLLFVIFTHCVVED